MVQTAIQGIAGSFHDIAARKFFEGEEIKIIDCKTFKDVFSAMRKDNNIIGLIAIENSIAGSLLQNYNLLRESDTSIIGEIKIRISHCLCTLPGQKMEDIKEIYSHPIALMQCGDFLKKHPDIIAVESDDTASSAKLIRDKNLKGRAAICSELAAETYGLEILEKTIETNKRNFTRFLVLSDKWNAEGLVKNKDINKSSLVFSTNHEAGALARVLSVLSFYENNMTKLQSMPILGHEWEYMFFVDLIFDDYLKYKQSIDAIRPLTKSIKILGEYTKGQQII